MLCNPLKITKKVHFALLPARVALSVVVLGLSSCASPPHRTSEKADINEIQAHLYETAVSVEQSLRTLAAAQNKVNQPAINTEPLMTVEGGMSKIVTVDWAGPIENLLQKIAEMSEYQLKVFGQDPNFPVLVSIYAKRAYLADLVKDAGIQAGARADIVVYPSTRVIELRFINAQ